MKQPNRRITFVTGTRAEFGLMGTTLRAIQSHRKLSLQIVATGMHLSRKHGYTVDEILKQGWTIDATVPWKLGSNPSQLAAATGAATAGLAKVFDRLRSDVVLVVGDRVEAFAAASAAHLSGRIVAHVHGGDRAMGQVDDALRHAITKLSHVHFAATPQSAERIARLGEDAWRIHTVGAPGIDGIIKQAASTTHLRNSFGVKPGRFGLVVHHPISADDKVEADRTRQLLAAMRIGARRYVIVCPNNDPGSAGIASVWETIAREPSVFLAKNLSRPDFLGLMRDASVLIGNSSSGIIEAASFGTPVIDIGPRQQGRENGPNVAHVGYDRTEIALAIARFIGGPDWSVRYDTNNPYGGRNTGKQIAATLDGLIMTAELRRKLIAY